MEANQNARDTQSKRQKAAHKELLENLNKVQEKIEDLSDSNLLSDEAFRQLSISNRDLYQSMKRMVEGLNELHIVYMESIMDSRQVNKWKNPSAAKSRCEERQKKQNRRNNIKCACGEYISRSYFDQHKKNQSHNDAMLRIQVDKKKVLQVQGVDKLLTLNAHLNSLKHSRKLFRYAPKSWRETEPVWLEGPRVITLYPRRGYTELTEYPPMYLLESWIRRYRIRKLGN